MSNKEVKEFSEKLRNGLKLAEKRTKPFAVRISLFHQMVRRFSAFPQSK